MGPALGPIASWNNSRTKAVCSSPARLTFVGMVPIVLRRSNYFDCIKIEMGYTPKVEGKLFTSSLFEDMHCAHFRSLCFWWAPSRTKSICPERATQLPPGWANLAQRKALHPRQRASHAAMRGSALPRPPLAPPPNHPHGFNGVATNPFYSG